MRQTATFRLSEQSAALLSLLNKQIGLTKTEIVERALKRYAERKLRARSGILQHAGKLTEKAAEDILLSIYSDRINKDIDLEGL